MQQQQDSTQTVDGKNHYKKINMPSKMCTHKKRKTAKTNFVCIASIRFRSIVYPLIFAHFYFVLFIIEWMCFLRPSACVSPNQNISYIYIFVCVAIHYDCDDDHTLYLMHFEVHGVRFKVKNLKRQCRRRHLNNTHTHTYISHKIHSHRKQTKALSQCSDNSSVCVYEKKINFKKYGIRIAPTAMLLHFTTR